MQKDEFSFEAFKKPHSFDYFNNEQYSFYTNDILNKTQQKISQMKIDLDLNELTSYSVTFYHKIAKLVRYLCFFLSVFIVFKNLVLFIF